MENPKKMAAELNVAGSVANLAQSDLSSEFCAFESKYCVNPHDITPVKSILKVEKDNQDIVVLNSPTDPSPHLSNLSERPIQIGLLKRNSTGVATAVTVANSQRNFETRDLEDFQDLTRWCWQTLKTENMSTSLGNDELNTPIIEFGDFFSAENIESSHKDDMYSVYATYDTDIYQSPTNFSPTQDEDIISNNNILGSAYIITQSGNNKTMNDQSISNINKYQFSNNNSFVDTMFYQTEPSLDTLNYIVNVSEMFPKSVHSDNTDNNNKASAILAGVPIELMEEHNDDIAKEFNVNNEFDERSSKISLRKELKLDFSNIITEKPDAAPGTAEVIEALLDEGFDFSLKEEVQLPIEDTTTNPNTPSSSKTQQYDQSEDSSNTIENTVNSSSDQSSDEDYEPPWKQRKTMRPKQQLKTIPANLKLKRESFDSELSSMASSIIEVKKRGRPPKRKESINSESNDSEGNKYRELRDKNNEASRRSRLNRKLKDLNVEQEANDLESRNSRLKSRVMELENLVEFMKKLILVKMKDSN